MKKVEDSIFFLYNITYNIFKFQVQNSRKTEECFNI